ncbi:hypothetical protein JMJ77_0005567 [Colletotrichum scovillei]|uniref:Uncharacterized protein n=1 Tax=Colletotrichum scovillei TaxID=1209932 RepID=A0A9P7RHG8_9PEZI|nr:hypothetical protein JMJ77_0005567 [Colletotrichum scovillei]KAG7076789.1 hypothetical protein JMJ76_0014048 [Colletotrichum scovillei]KAG7083934.1 hypothetical protein JMJ78_0009374 [Colletotrichum scovillei]
MASQTLLHTLRRPLPGIITRPSPFPTTPTAPPQTRLFSNASTLRAKVVHPDIDRYIRYSLRDGPPRTSRPKPLFSLSHQCPWPKIIPMTAASASFTSAFQPTLSQRRASSSSSTTPSLDAKKLKDEEDKKELSRQIRRFESQLNALGILQEDLTDRASHVYRENHRLLSHMNALNVITERMVSRSKILSELERRSAAGETIFTDECKYDGAVDGTRDSTRASTGNSAGNSIEAYLSDIEMSLCGLFFYLLFWGLCLACVSKKLIESSETQELKKVTASDSSLPRNAAEVKSKGGDEEVQELQYLAKP